MNKYLTFYLSEAKKLYKQFLVVFAVAFFAIIIWFSSRDAFLASQSLIIGGYSNGGQGALYSFTPIESLPQLERYVNGFVYEQSLNKSCKVDVANYDVMRLLINCRGQTELEAKNRLNTIAGEVVGRHKQVVDEYNRAQNEKMQKYKRKIERLNNMTGNIHRLGSNNTDMAIIKNDRLYQIEGEFDDARGEIEILKENMSMLSNTKYDSGSYSIVDRGLDFYKITYLLLVAFVFSVLITMLIAMAKTYDK